MYQFQIISKSRPVTKIWGTRPNEFRSFFQDWHVRKCKENREVAVSDMQRPLTWWGSAMPREICHSYLPSIQEHVSISLISTLSFLYRRKQNGFINLPWSCSLPSTMVLLPLQNHWKTTGKLQKPKSPLAWHWLGIGLALAWLGDFWVIPSVSVSPPVVWSPGAFSLRLPVPCLDIAFGIGRLIRLIEIMAMAIESSG